MTHSENSKERAARLYAERLDEIGVVLARIDHDALFTIAVADLGRENLSDFARTAQFIALRRLP